MTEEEYISAFMEGCTLAPLPATLTLTLSRVYALSKQVGRLTQEIQMMDDVVRDAGITVKCRGCGEYYDLPCELSEFDPEYSYCNSGHGGAYHCAP